METIINYQDIHVRYNILGKGTPLILLHGYLESIAVWGSFSEKLAENFQVISIDLLGHGKTGILGNTHTMKQMAQAVNHVLNHLQLSNIHLLGHSMGGYVSLRYAHDYPETIKSLILLHSSAKADTQDKKVARQRTIELIHNGKKEMVTSQHVPKTFAPENIPKFVHRIEQLKKIAADTPEKGIIAALNGMKERTDFTGFLNKTDFPVLMIAGKKDNFIPFSVSEEHFGLSDNITPCILENSGHMGFIEEENKTLENIKNFIHQNTNGKTHQS